MHVLINILEIYLFYSQNHLWFLMFSSNLMIFALKFNEAQSFVASCFLVECWLPPSPPLGIGKCFDLIAQHVVVFQQ